MAFVIKLRSNYLKLLRQRWKSVGLEIDFHLLRYSYTMRVTTYVPRVIKTPMLHLSNLRQFLWGSLQVIVINEIRVQNFLPIESFYTFHLLPTATS